MSTHQVSWSPSVVASTKVASHPLSPLSAFEISRSSQLMRALYPSHTDLHFKVVTLEEPKKAQLIPYLDAEHHGGTRPPLDRKAFVCYYIRNTVSQIEAIGIKCESTVNATAADEGKM